MGPSRKPETSDEREGLRVERAERELERLASRVRADWRQLGRAGLHILSAASDREGNVVAVSLWTRRADASDALLARYGPGIRVEVVADRATYDQCTAVYAYRPARGGRAPCGSSAQGPGPAPAGEGSNRSCR